MAIILVQSEKTASGEFDHYQDETGKRYQFPLNYKNIIIPGEFFIYYRGLRKKDGKRRKAVEYFGFGIIDNVFKNEELSKERGKEIWDCTLREYEQFLEPVIAKEDGEGIYEKISNNQWGYVRRITKEQFLRITSKGLKKRIKNSSSVIPEISNSKKPFSVNKNKEFSTEENNYSKRAKYIGDLGEQLVFNKLKAEMVKELKWVANENIKPGWDIQYRDSQNSLICVEVKSTIQKEFSSIQITKNEYDRAQEKGENYHVWLVTEVESQGPKIHIIKNLSASIKSDFLIEPINYRLVKN